MKHSLWSYFRAHICTICLFFLNLHCVNGIKRTIPRPKSTPRTTSSGMQRTPDKIISARMRQKSQTIDGGAYRSISPIPGHEKHHLITANFCRKSGICLVSEAAAILIPIQLHELTSSYRNTKISSAYRTLEKYVYSKTKKLRMVCWLGLRDYSCALSKFNKDERGLHPIEDEICSSPCKKARIAACDASAKKQKIFKQVDISPIPFSISDIDAMPHPEPLPERNIIMSIRDASAKKQKIFKVDISPIPLSINDIDAMPHPEPSPERNIIMSIKENPTICLDLIKCLLRGFHFDPTRDPDGATMDEDLDGILLDLRDIIINKYYY